MALSHYPTLMQLHQDLQRMESVERNRLAELARQRKRDSPPPSVDRVSLPYLPRPYWLSPGQREIVRVLMESLANRVPDVHESILVKAAGARPGTKVRELFRGTPGEVALDELVLPGTTPATWRLAPPPEIVDDEARVVPPED